MEISINSSKKTKTTATMKSSIMSTEEEYGYSRFITFGFNSIEMKNLFFFLFFLLHFFLFPMFSVIDRDDENGPAECAAHYTKAQVDGMIFELGNCVHVNVS